MHFLPFYLVEAQDTEVAAVINPHQESSACDSKTLLYHIHVPFSNFRKQQSVNIAETTQVVAAFVQVSAVEGAR